jgi:hypothetical protein
VLPGIKPDPAESYDCYREFRATNVLLCPIDLAPKVTEKSMRKLPLAIAIAVAPMAFGAAMCAGQTSSNTAICAEREITLEMLIEAYGTAPNASRFADCGKIVIAPSGAGSAKADHADW